MIGESAGNLVDLDRELGLAFRLPPPAALVAEPDLPAAVRLRVEGEIGDLLVPRVHRDPLAVRAKPTPEQDRLSASRGRVTRRAGHPHPHRGRRSASAAARTP